MIRSAQAPTKTSKGRILCVTSNFPRWEGDSTTPFVLNLAQDLQKLGWSVDVLAPHAPGAAKKERIGEVTVERFQYLWPEGAETVCYQGGALINLRRNKMNAIKLPALVLAEWWAVFRRLVTRRYDAIHTHWILPQGFVGAVSAGLLGVPHVLTVHGGDVFALQGRFLRYLKRQALGSADRVTVNSSVTESAVHDIHSSMSSLKRIPIGVTMQTIDRNAPKVHSIRERYRRGNGPLLVFVGRLVDEKGCADLLEAIRLLKTELPDMSALVIGEGQDRQALEDFAADHCVSDRTTFVGWVQPHEILAHIAAADVFVGPSRTGSDGWVEAQGLTFLEAMVAGTPIVATRTGGIVDSVRDGETGLLVEQRAPDQIAEAVKRLTGDPELATRLTLQARRLVAAVFSREVSAAAFDSVFSDLLPQGKHSEQRV